MEMSLISKTFLLVSLNTQEDSQTVLRNHARITFKIWGAGVVPLFGSVLSSRGVKTPQIRLRGLFVAFLSQVETPEF